MKESFLQLSIDTNKIVLSSESLFFKTENFIAQTKNLTNIDLLLSKLCEIIVSNKKDFLAPLERLDKHECYCIKTIDQKFNFVFKFGDGIGRDLNKYDIIFCEYIANEKDKLDERIEDYLKRNSILKVVAVVQKKKYSESEFNKLYLISNVSNVNLPRLNEVQRSLVETVDKNVLVQGVAGSGKTNICIDKIIYTSCRNYSGKVLYTTFSRGLLADTKLKVSLYKQDLEQVLQAYKTGNIIFLDSNHKKALENRLGIYFFSDDDNEIFAKLKRVVSYLDNNVDYLLIEDMYRNRFGESAFVGQEYFLNSYSKNLTNHQLEKNFSKLAKYSKEIIYKEIYGMIMGFCDIATGNIMLTLEEYVSKRENSFSRVESEAIYQIALDFKKHCEKQGLKDNNIASKELMESIKKDFEYSLVIIDEVQDFTQVNLMLFKKLSLKMFCVGDALQMINPAYFSFGYLKNLMYEKDVTDVKTLSHNYRNSAKIEEIIDALADINKAEFGTHNFVVKGESVDSGVRTEAVFVSDANFINKVAREKFDNFTFVVASDEEKKKLKKTIKNQEVLTVSEIKGLERPTVIVYNILSSNRDKWDYLDRVKVAHKQADENSVFRYYYNLFYVGVSRAKQNIFVVEDYSIKQFVRFFQNNFVSKDYRGALSLLEQVVGKVDITQEEILSRVLEFVKAEQYDNARFVANKIQDNDKKISVLRQIDINEQFVRYGKYREAGIRFWEYGLLDEAKKQFVLSGDTILIELIERCSSRGNHKDLNIDIVNYFEEVKDNRVAREFILDTVKKDVQTLKNSFSSIRENFKKGKV